MTDRPVDRSAEGPSGSAPGRDEDDEALSWAGDESAAKPSRRAGTSAPVDPVADAVSEAELDADAQPVVEASSSVLLVASGVLGGIYLLFTVGWVVSGQTSPALEGLPRVMYTLGQWLAMAAPALWFGATLLLTRHRPAPIKLLWLVIGMLLLVPWPFILNR